MGWEFGRVSTTTIRPLCQCRWPFLGCHIDMDGLDGECFGFSTYEVVPEMKGRILTRPLGIFCDTCTRALLARYRSDYIIVTIATVHPNGLHNLEFGVDYSFW